MVGFHERNARTEAGGQNVAKHENDYSHILPTCRTKTFFVFILDNETHIASIFQHDAVNLKEANSNKCDLAIFW